MYCATSFFEYVSYLKEPSFNVKFCTQVMANFAQDGNGPICIFEIAIAYQKKSCNHAESGGTFPV